MTLERNVGVVETPTVYTYIHLWTELQRYCFNQCTQTFNALIVERIL